MREFILYNCVGNLDVKFLVKCELIIWSFENATVIYGKSSFANLVFNRFKQGFQRVINRF